jgi:ketosteroid isomerase-like protein
MVDRKRGPRLSLVAIAMGAGGMLLARALFARALLFKLRRDVEALNRGDFGPLLSGYAPDAVLRFNDGDHRWAGEHRGRDAIAAFLGNFVGAGLQGQITEAFFAGPPWRMTILARFDDHANGPAGDEIYSNRTVLLARSRWGRIVEQEDFYEDTERIGALDARLRELGVEPTRRTRAGTSAAG